MKKKETSFVWGLTLFLMSLLMYGTYVGLNFLIFCYSPSNSKFMGKVVLEVHRGMNRGVIARKLLEKGVIQDEKKFLLLGRLTKDWNQLKVGEYEFSAALSPLQIFSILTSGVSIQHPITVREGENIYEIAEDLETQGLASAKEFVQLCQSSDFIQSLGLEASIHSLEGYLYPDTYFFTKLTSVQEIIRIFFYAFLNQWSPDFQARSQVLGFSRHAVMTLASIIEKETGAPEERPIISSVFHNRLKKGMRLQSDPTTIYGMWQRFQGKIHKADLLEKTEYNTYTIPALPVGPISNPGKAAIFAALYPSETSYFFFVSHNDGTHEFTSNYQDHLEAVKKYQLDPQAREGKSWRDLKQREKKAVSVQAPIF